MKYILVTGVSTGIGYNLCQELLFKSFFVIGTVRKEEDRVKLQSEFGPNFKAVLLDVTDQDSLSNAFLVIQNVLGENNLTGLVNNAGIAVPGPLSEMTNEDFEWQMNVNVNGMFRVTNQFFPLLKKTDVTNSTPGRIINISSISGLLNTPFLGAYCVSKHAVESLSDIYRRELDLYGIKVIIIEPGPIKSEIWEKSLNSMAKYEDSDYWTYLKDTDKVVKSTEKHALEPKVLSDVIIKALMMRKPKLRYIVHKQKRLIYLVHHLLPARWMDMLTRKKLKSMAAGNTVKRY